MNSRTARILLAVLAASAADVGGWAVVAPRSFYNSFPGGGHRWVTGDGPFNEHLVRDVGGLYLGLLVLSVWAFAQPALRRVAGASWLAFSIPHFSYHLAHVNSEPHLLSTSDKVGLIASLGGTLVIAAFLLLAPARAVARRRNVTSPVASSSST